MFDRASLYGASHYDVFPDIPERWKAAHWRGLAGETVRCDEDRFDHADGTVQWLRWELRPWHAPDGSVGGSTIFTEDIAARKRAEQSMRASEERFSLPHVNDSVASGVELPEVAYAAKLLGLAGWQVPVREPDQAVRNPPGRFMSEPSQRAASREGWVAVTENMTEIVARSSPKR